MAKKKSARPVGRPKLFEARVLLSLTRETVAKIDQCPDPESGETRVSFIRDAVLRELSRRKRA